MILTHQKDNHLYLVFQDFEDKIEDIYKKIKEFSPKASSEIKKILRDNFFSDTLQRQRDYVNSISTYIDDISDDGKQYFFHLYILPKDIKINHTITDKDELIEKIEKLSFKLFELYSQLDINNRNIKLFEQNKGQNFLQLEANFYINKLDKLYSYLLNYKSHSKNKIICSDRHIGIEIEELNRLESNPLKNYQFIKVAYQKELIKFVYTTISFLKITRIEIFKSKAEDEYQILIKLVNKINNLLLKISSSKSMIDEKVSKERLPKYLQQYKNKKEIKDNRKIYEIIKSIFYTQLDNNVQFFMSMNLAKIFEKLVEKKLSKYYNNLFIGDESVKSIVTSAKIKDKLLNSINYLLKSPQKIKQYPDFFIKGNIGSQEIYHIIDAKYKLKRNILNEQDVRQVLTYAILFNKAYSQNLQNQKYIKKFIIYTKTSSVDLNKITNLSLNINKIDIFTKNDNFLYYEDNLFDSEIIFIGLEFL
jgi:hypothetical protein